jgi:hypothetical protein
MTSLGIASIFVVASCFVLFVAATALAKHNKLLAVGIVLGAVGVVALAINTVEHRGTAKDKELEWRNVEEAKVVWFKPFQRQHISILLDWGNGPRLYSYPYSGQFEQQLLAARRGAAAVNGTITMKKPFGKQTIGGKEKGDKNSKGLGDNKGTQGTSLVVVPPQLPDKE